MWKFRPNSITSVLHHRRWWVERERDMAVDFRFLVFIADYEVFIRILLTHTQRERRFESSLFCSSCCCCSELSHRPSLPLPSSIDITYTHNFLSLEWECGPPMSISVWFISVFHPVHTYTYIINTLLLYSLCISKITAKIKFLTNIYLFSFAGKSQFIGFSWNKHPGTILKKPALTS